MQEFKKGPFYLRDDIDKNIVPAIVFGAYECWPPGRTFAAPGRTLVRFLPEFVPDKTKNRNLNRLALRRLYLDAFAADVPNDIGCAASTNYMVFHVVGTYIIWCITLKTTYLSYAFLHGVCTLFGISWWTLIKLSMFVTVILESFMFTTC